MKEIEAELRCEKGKGKVHAKWSPVATAYYRLMPHIEILDKITGDKVVDFYRISECVGSRIG